MEAACSRGAQLRSVSFIVRWCALLLHRCECHRASDFTGIADARATFQECLADSNECDCLGEFHDVVTASDACPIFDVPDAIAERMRRCLNVVENCELLRARVRTCGVWVVCACVRARGRCARVRALKGRSRTLLRVSLTPEPLRVAGGLRYNHNCVAGDFGAALATGDDVVDCLKSNPVCHCTPMLHEHIGAMRACNQTVPDRLRTAFQQCAQTQCTSRDALAVRAAVARGCCWMLPSVTQQPSLPLCARCAPRVAACPGSSACNARWCSSVANATRGRVLRPSVCRRPLRTLQVTWTWSAA